MIELLVVITIISILASMLLPALASAKEKAKYGRWIGYKNGLRADPSLVAYYDFEEGEDFAVGSKKVVPNLASGANAENYVAYRYDGVRKPGASWMASARFRGKPGLHFSSGSGGRLDCGNSGVHCGNPVDYTLTAECWFSSTFQGKWFRTLVSKYGYGSMTPSWGLGWMDTNKIGFYARTDKIGGKQLYEKATAPSGLGLDGEWHHAVGVREASGGGGGKVRFYLDGELVATKNVPGNKDLPITPKGGQELLVADHMDNSQSSEASIDEVAVYQRALTAEEVKQHYQMGRPK